MTTIINPGNRDDSNGVVSMVIAVVVIVLLAGLFIVYVLPAMRGSNQPAPQQESPGINVDVKLPEGNDGGTPEPEGE